MTQAQRDENHTFLCTDPELFCLCVCIQEVGKYSNKEPERSHVTGNEKRGRNQSHKGRSGKNLEKKQILPEKKNHYKD